MPYKRTRSKVTLPGDPRHGTRWATVEERQIAARAIDSLEAERNSIILVPAPDPHFEGQKIRTIESRNPRWYREFVAGRWNRRGCQIKRSRVINALKRVTVVGIVRRNGFEVQLLEVLTGVPEFVSNGSIRA